MMILVSCDQQTPANNDDLMLGSPSNSGSDYDPYKDDFFRIDENGEFVEYRNIQPKSKRHITRELLLEAEKGLEIIYQYMY